MHLDELKPGQSATIARIHADQALAQRLHALGFRAGKRLQVMRQAAFHGPLHVRLGSTDVIIRVQDAKAIHLQTSPIDTETSPA